MSKKLLYFGIIIIIEMFLFQSQAGGFFSSETEDEDRILHPAMTSNPPVIDGDLDDEIWQQIQPLNKDFITFAPIYGEVLPQKTIVWMTYDNENLYFAYRCYDSEPAKIKTSITKRDNIWNDDLIAVAIDSLGTKQSAFQFFVNPNGIQGDNLFSVVSGVNRAADFVWYSAGRLTEDGYHVEIRIPLRSIRFKSGEEVKMGIYFSRKISRFGTFGGWPEWKQGYGFFNVHATIVYRNLKNPLNLEVLPSIVYGRNDERESPDSWGETDVFNDYGIGVKYGITSSITADVTINPDFSQVESDAFQVEVNQRYPLFYSEKRPFFMEGADTFSFFVSGDQMSTPVHTRRIADPNWAAKVTGTKGKAAFGILAADDRSPGLAWDDEVNPFEGKSAYFTIARGKYSLRGENYIGALYSGREFVGGYNRVIGADFMRRFLTHHQASFSFLQSYSKEPEGAQSTKSSGLNFLYAYDTKPFAINLSYERYGTDFRMDSAFYNRVGISNGQIYIAPSFYPDAKKVPWLKKITPMLTAVYLHDYATNMDDKNLGFHISFDFIRQGYIIMCYHMISESWANQAFDKRYFYFGGRVQIIKWLHLSGFLNIGNRIYYDPVNPYVGKGKTIRFGLTYQPNDKLSQYIEYNLADLNHPLDNSKVYEVNIINSHTTYQFNKFFFVRAILQYDSHQHKLLTDFLGSCTIIPGTVFHIGYGALYLKRDWQQEQWVNNGFGYMHNMKRSLFFKASYLWRF